jgi:Amidohydrolase family
MFELAFLEVRMNRLSATLALVLVLVVSAGVALGASPATLFVHATLVDGTGAPAVANAWVRIEDDRITGVGSGEISADGARVIDLSGRSVLPGLADMHVHLGSLPRAKWMLDLFLAEGVTTLKDNGNSLGNLAAIRRWLDSEKTAPHLYVSGFILQGDYEEQRFLKPGREAKEKLEDELAFGIDFVKTYNWTSSGALKQIVGIARDHGVKVTGHTPLSWSSIGSIDAGMYILEHLRLRPYEVLDDFELIAKYPVDEALMRRTGFWAHVKEDSAAVGKTLDAWEKRRDRFYVTPTLVVQEASAESYDYPDPRFTVAGDPALARVSPAMIEEWQKSSPPTFWGDLTPPEIAEAKASFDGMALFVKLAHLRGIQILAGTDSPEPWLVPGASLHRELRHFVERCGMSPVEAIHTATGRAAAALGVADRGTIRAGNVADLLIVRGDVGRDIGALDGVETVVLSGAIHERGELLERAAERARLDVPGPK